MLIVLELDSAAVWWVRKDTRPSPAFRRRKKIGHITFVPTIICEILFVSCCCECSDIVGLLKLHQTDVMCMELGHL